MHIFGAKNHKYQLNPTPKAEIVNDEYEPIGITQSFSEAKETNENWRKQF